MWILLGQKTPPKLMIYFALKKFIEDSCTDNNMLGNKRITHENKFS